jgi:rubrerythrin
MFTIREISKLAVQIETNGEAVYREVAAKTANPALKTLLEELAEEERQHARWFGRLGETGPGDGVDAEGELEAMGRALLADMLGEQTFSLNADDLQHAEAIADVIEQAAEFERDTIVFYEMLADFIEEPIVAAQLEEIIAEERAHIRKLKGFAENR